MVHHFIVDVAMTEFVKLTIHFNRDYFIFLPCIVYVVINSPVGVEMVLLKKISIVSKVNVLLLLCQRSSLSLDLKHIISLHFGRKSENRKLGITGFVIEGYRESCIINFGRAFQ